MITVPPSSPLKFTLATQSTPFLFLIRKASPFQHLPPVFHTVLNVLFEAETSKNFISKVM